MSRLRRTIDLAPISAYYDELAARYTRYSAPVITPLITNLIDSILVPLDDVVVLDVGTGTGIGAPLLADRGANVIGIDLSAGMLLEGRRSGVQTALAQADLNHAPFASACFDLIVSSFGLNQSNPRQALREMARLLLPGGWLVGQEWAVQDPVIEPLDMAIFELTAAKNQPRFDIFESFEAWSSQMQDTEDYNEQLSAAGFTAIQIKEGVPIILRLSLRTFIAYRAGWGIEHTPNLVDDVAQQLAYFADADGMITWQPSLFRFTAQKPPA